MGGSNMTRSKKPKTQRKPRPSRKRNLTKVILDTEIPDTSKTIAALQGPVDRKKFHPRQKTSPSDPARPNAKTLAIQKRIFDLLCDEANWEIPVDELIAKAGMATDDNAKDRRRWKYYCTPDLKYAAIQYLRTNYVDHLPAIDKKMIEQAKAGDSRARETAYERIEGWTPRQKHDEQQDQGAVQEAWDLLGEDDKRAISDRLAQSLRQRHLGKPASDADHAGTGGEGPGVVHAGQRDGSYVGQKRRGKSVQAAADGQGVHEVRDQGAPRVRHSPDPEES